MQAPDSRSVRGDVPRSARLLDALGRTLIGAGTLLLLFVVYQLWGTGLRESREQDRLEKKFAAIVQTAGSTGSPDSLEPLPARGEPVSRIKIPRIGVDKVLVGGVDMESLKKGPGLFPGSPLPGQLGNVAIAGHRTTYGAPFEDLDRVAVGDEIVFETPTGTRTYRVHKEPYNVYPSNVEVVATKDPTRATVTLVTCTPKYTSWKRLIVEAELVGKDQGDLAPPTPAATPPSADPATPFVDEIVAFDEGWFHDTSVIPNLLGLGALLVAIGITGARLARRSGRRLLVWSPTGIVFLFVLFWFFENLTGLLPTNI